MIQLLLILTLNFSPIETSQTTEEVYASTTDTLKYTSGIRSIFKDSKGNYWFGSLQEGVAVYNGNTFTYFTVADGLADRQILAIQEDSKGVIWFTSQNGVSSYDGKEITNHTQSNKQAVPGTFSFQLTDAHKSEWMKTDQDLWFGAGTKEGVYRYDGQTISYLAFPEHKVLDLYDNLFAVTDISEGKNNMTWFATYAGVFGYNGSDFTIINDEKLGFDRDVAPLHIRSILEDSKGRLWIGNNGMGVLLKEGDSIVNFSEQHHLIHPTSKRRGDQSPPGTLEHVFTIAEDSQGNIWFGDRDAGIWKYDGASMVNYTTKDGLSSDCALSIYEDKKKTLWFGMEDGSTYWFIDGKFERRF